MSMLLGALASYCLNDGNRNQTHDLNLCHPLDPLAEEAQINKQRTLALLRKGRQRIASWFKFLSLQNLLERMYLDVQHEQKILLLFKTIKDTMSATHDTRDS